jgi:hypothetical protein
MRMMSRNRLSRFHFRCIGSPVGRLPDDGSFVSAVGAVTPVPAETVSFRAYYHATNPLAASQTDTVRGPANTSSSPFVDIKAL